MIRNTLRVLYSLRSQTFDPRRWPRVPGEIARYISDFKKFRVMSAAVGRREAVTLDPVLFQREINSPFDSHYTYQAAWATRRIARENPAEHVDVSSQVPFVAQLAAVVPVTMYEFRAPDIAVPGLTLKEATVVSLPFEDRAVRSLSCMHVIEHVGLGRYGDPLDPEGMDKAIRELARVLAPGGSLYVSLPVGRPRVCFNAHRVADPRALSERFEAQGLSLKEFALVDDRARFHDPATFEMGLAQEYGCGMFRFTRP